MERLCEQAHLFFGEEIVHGRVVLGDYIGDIRHRHIPLLVPNEGSDHVTRVVVHAIILEH
jgi:hypothetical protein